MTLPRRRLIALTGSILVAVPALAADPPNGKVSNSSPTVSWTGDAPGYGQTAANVLVTAGGERPVCSPGTCDTFALEVADSADLTITATATVGDIMAVEVEKPDGSTIYDNGVDQTDPGAEGNPATTIKIKKAPTGAYTINLWTNNPVGTDGTYSASASLTVAGAPAPATTPAPGATTAPGTPPAPGATPAPAPAASTPATTLTVKTRKASARKARRKLVVALSSSGPVTGITASLSKGKKVVARGKLARLSGNGKVTLKPKRKLKPGKYVVGVYGKDARGATVGGTAPLKITR